MTDNNQRVNEQVAWTGAGGGAPHCSWCYKRRTACTCGSLKAAIEHCAASHNAEGAQNLPGIPVSQRRI